MELCGIEIESFEQYKSLIEENSENESFRQELIDAYIDGALLSLAKSWNVLEAKQYADTLSKLNYYGLTDSELFNKIIDFLNITVEERDLTKYFILELLEINREHQNVTYKIKVTKTAYETLSLSFRFLDVNNVLLHNELVNLSLNVSPNTEIIQSLPLPQTEKEIISAALYCNNTLISKEEVFHDITFSLMNGTLKMVAVEGGSFKMGATDEQLGDAQDDEKPAHPVRLSRFYIGEVPVTQKLWVNIMKENPSIYKGGELPVENITKDECTVFIERLNRILSSQLKNMRFSLPTEAQWEYAARGGEKSKGYKFSGSNIIDEVAWYRQNSGDRTHPVAQKRPNELGIYDMSGNVSEWCLDEYANYTEKAQENPISMSSNSQYYSTRGGDRYDNENHCRVSSRSSRLPENKSSYTGFRLVLNIDDA